MVRYEETLADQPSRAIHDPGPPVSESALCPVFKPGHADASNSSACRQRSCKKAECDGIVPVNNSFLTDNFGKVAIVGIERTPGARFPTRFAWRADTSASVRPAVREQAGQVGEELLQWNRAILQSFDGAQLREIQPKLLQRLSRDSESDHKAAVHVLEPQCPIVLERLSNRFEGRFTRLTNRWNLALKVSQKKGAAQLTIPHPSL